MGFLDIVDGFPSCSSWLSLIYLILILEKFDGVSGDIWWLSWRIDGSPGDLVGVLDILGGYPGDIWYVAWRYLLGVLDIYDGYPRDIWRLSWRYL